MSGSGKTVLCSSVIEELLKFRASNRDILVLYFFFDFASPNKSTASNFLRACLQQLLAQVTPIPPPVRTLYADHCDGLQQPSEKALLDTLHNCLKGTGPTYLVMDALDECIEKIRLPKVITDIISWNLENNHLLATSRPDRDIEAAFIPLNCCTLPMETPEINKDICQHVYGTMLEDTRLKKWPEEVRTEIATAIIANAGGMFRWAACQLEALKRCISLKQLRIALGSLPKTLEDTYSRELSHIDQTMGPTAFTMLNWLCFSAIPLTLEEMAEVLAVDSENLEYDPSQKLQDPQDLLSICGCLVTISTQLDGSLRLAHYSVKEYLVSSLIQHSNLSRWHIEELSAEKLIIRTCLAYLRYCDNLWHREVAPQKNIHTLHSLLPFTKYSLNFWGFHFKLAGEPSELLSSVLELLVGPDSHFLDWAWLAGTLPEGHYTEDPQQASAPRRDILLYYASLIGSPKLIDCILSTGANIDAIGGNFGSALMLAAYRGDNECVEHLLANGADVNAQSKHHGSALHAAAAWGWTDIMALLISHGVDVNFVGGLFHTALLAAIQSDIWTVGTVELLLNAGADIRLGKSYISPLAEASRHGKEDIVKLLLERGADPNEGGGAPLQFALMAAELGIADLLIRRGAQVNTTGGPSGSPLSAATLGGVEALDFLIEVHNADYNQTDNEGRTCLHIAASSTDTEVIKHLIKNGLDINQKDAKGWTAVHYAAMTRTSENLRIVLQYWNLEAPEQSNTWTPLHIASCRNEPAAIELLVESGFRPSTVKTLEPEWDWTPFDIALAHENYGLLSCYQLISIDGEAKHPFLRSIEPALEPGVTRPTSESTKYKTIPIMRKRRDWECDGCNIRYESREIDVSKPVNPHSLG